MESCVEYTAGYNHIIWIQRIDDTETPLPDANDAVYDRKPFSYKQKSRQVTSR